MAKVVLVGGFMDFPGFSDAYWAQLKQALKASGLADVEVVMPSPVASLHDR
jgi:hypothetical protein